MKVSGFTFVRNAIKFDYPVVESILSILPLCDEVVVAVGSSEDKTLDLIRSINSPKLKIVETIWDDTLREGGKTLAMETNKAFSAIDPSSEWAFYIQADEVLHEKHIPVIRQEMEKWKDNKRVEGLLFKYVHFYGSYDYVGDSRKWYRKEIRIIKNDKNICSYKDAQGFRKQEKKLNVKEIDATIFHYGWVKPPILQQAKQEYFHKMWHDDKWVEKNIEKRSEFDYSKIDSLKMFTETHPLVMKERIIKKNWHFDFDPTEKKMTIKERFLFLIERNLGWRIGEYKNYKLI